MTAGAAEDAGAGPAKEDGAGLETPAGASAGPARAGEARDGGPAASARPPAEASPAPRDRSPGPRDESRARHVAAGGFLWGEWFGALVMVMSFAQLYVVVVARLASGRAALTLGAALLALGAFLYLRSRRIYLSFGAPHRPRLHWGAAVVAGSAAIFWLLFLLLAGLTVAGVPILPDG